MVLSATKKVHEISPGSPAVGIFWSISSGGLLALAIDLTPLSQAETYGDFLTHPRGHYEVWEGWRGIGHAGLKHRGLPNVILWREYEDYPRGRIVFRRPEKEFIIYADRRLQGPDVVDRIVQIFQLLNQRYSVQSDSHYR